MDVCIDTAAVEEGINGLFDVVHSISASIADMQSCVRSAHDDFETINYDCANDAIAAATAALESMQTNLESARQYLTHLCELIERYENLKY